MKKLILLILVLLMLVMPVLVYADSDVAKHPDFNNTGAGENMNRHPSPPGWAETEPPGPIGTGP